MNLDPLPWTRQTQLAFFGDDLDWRNNRLLSLTLAQFGAPLPFVFCKQPTSFPRHYLFLTGLTKAAPKEETSTQLPKLSPAKP